MEHPFMPDLSTKNIDELQTTIQELTSKLTFAHRMGKPFLVNQINMVIEGYQKEYNRKMDEMYKKQGIQSSINIQKT